MTNDIKKKSRQEHLGRPLPPPTRTKALDIKTKRGADLSSVLSVRCSFELLQPQHWVYKIDLDRLSSHVQMPSRDLILNANKSFERP